MNNNISAYKPQNQDLRVTSKEDDKRNSTLSEGQASEFAQSKEVDKVQTSISMTNRKILNASILESALQYEGSVANQPQSLLLKTALEGINEALKTLGVDKSIEQSSEQEIDVSPEATAERIVAFSTNLFPLYLKQNPELEEKDALSKFMGIIEGGIEQGFSEAKEVLTGLNVLEGDVAENIEKTFELVQQGLTDFIDNYDKSEAEKS